MRRLRVTHVAADVAHGFVDVSICDDQIDVSIEIHIGKCAAKAESAF